MNKKDYDNKTAILTSNSKELEIHGFVNLASKQSRRQGLRVLSMAMLIIESEGPCGK